jgi:DUF4097 and DUF4098 domain-containing protein YvlB
MMRFFSALFFLMLAANIYSQDVLYVEREEKQFDFYPGGNLEVTAGAPGTLKIVGWQKGSIRMEAEKIVHNLPPEKAKTVIEQNPIRVKWNQTSATIRTIISPASEVAMEINLTLYVPQEKTDITAKIFRGNFSVDQVNGWIESTILYGDITAKSVAGYFSAVTQQGNIYTDMSGNRWFGREFAAITHAGSANLLLPIHYSAALQLETNNGKVSVDYPPQVVDGEAAPLAVLTKKNAQFIKAAVGDGGPLVKLTTFSGDVTLSKKPQNTN